MKYELYKDEWWPWIDVDTIGNRIYITGIEVELTDEELAKIKYFNDVVAERTAFFEDLAEKHGL